MARPIKSTPVKRFFKYLGLLGAGVAIPVIHSQLHPPDNMNRSGYKSTVFWTKFLFHDRGISTKMFGEGQFRDGPFDPQSEKPV